MKTTNELKWETNRTIYNRLLKRYRSQKCLISCGFCPYHEWENDWISRKDKRNWKRYRKHQYKEAALVSAD